MAALLSSVHKSSDLVKDYCCAACEDNKIEEIADFYCEMCMKFFCGKCIFHHGQLYANHSKYGREEINKWPLTKKMEDLLLKCEVHKDDKLKMICQDHSQLCCTNCAFLNHRQCTKVNLISESAKNQFTDLKTLSVRIHNILEEMKKLQNNREVTIQSLEGSYNERLQEVRDVRQKLNVTLDKLERTTLKELDDMRTALQASLKTDVDNCTRLKDELKLLIEAVQELGDKSKEILSFIANKKCLDKIQESEVYLKQNSGKVESSITFQADTDIEQSLSKQLGLGKVVQRTQSLAVQGNPNHVFTVKQKFEYDVKIQTESSHASYITGICAISNDKIILADNICKRVKMLDQQYYMTSHLDVSVSVGDMCQISEREVAVTVADGNTHGVQFISVNNGQLVKGRKLQLQHISAGIAHHEGNLYVTSRTALYHYTLSGKLEKKIYEDTTNVFTVWKCAVSPTGDRIYVTNFYQHKLLTLSRDGTILSMFTDAELQKPLGVHVSGVGHVLVCGHASHNIIQVDSEGRKKLAILATQNDGVEQPVSVCYKRNTDSVIVGLLKNNKILVLEVQ